MALEIEHKYLVNDTSYKDAATTSIEIRQGYLSTDPDRVVRVRIWGTQGFLTVKGRTVGDTREEFEYEIPTGDAEAMLCMCHKIIEKRRWIVPYGGFTWEIDEFFGRHNGLVLAEIELPATVTEYSLPSFVGDNVTDNPAYYNSVLVQS